MQIICKDGTTIQCHDFEAISAGVLFFQEPPSQAGGEESEDDDDAEIEEDARADGFVPITELHFVLPDEMVQQPSRQAAMREQSQAAQQMPTQQGVPSQQGPPPQHGGMAQQQQMQQFPGDPSQQTR